MHPPIDTHKTKYTILYSRLSKEDARENESLSIENQKQYLEEYACKNGLTNTVHLSDDGWSGTRWDRPAFMQMMHMVESNQVEQICIKDMSRLGRDHLRVGLFLEELQGKDIRLIAVSESIDTARGEDDFMPFRNLFSEWHARDTSRKIRAINETRTKNGKRVSGAIPYGYLHSHDRQSWILDEDTVPIIKRIFFSILEGKGIQQIANELSHENILTPSAHWDKIGVSVPGKQASSPTKWSPSCIANILKREEYMGWKVLNKTISYSYKTKKREKNLDMLIFKDSHPSIIEEELFKNVQRLRKTKRRQSTTSDPKNPLTGMLFCADCNSKMYHKKSKSNDSQPSSEYVCTSYRSSSSACTIHYIRAKAAEELILDTIKHTCYYVKNNKAEFLKRVQEITSASRETEINESNNKLLRLKLRYEGQYEQIKKLYEAYALDKIPEYHFSNLLMEYENNIKILEDEIIHLQSKINTHINKSTKAETFIDLINRHTQFTTLTAPVLNDFIEKVIVHEAVYINGKRNQQIDIYLNYIGRLELP